MYIDNLGVQGTSRVNVDEDLMMAVQTLKNRGLDTHEEIVHSNSATALGIHIDFRNMLVSVAPTRLWRLKQGLRWALRCRALTEKMGGAPFGRPSARAEVEAFVCLLQLVFTHCRDRCK